MGSVNSKKNLNEKDCHGNATINANNLSKTGGVCSLPVISMNFVKRSELKI